MAEQIDKNIEKFIASSKDDLATFGYNIIDTITSGGTSIVFIVEKESKRFAAKTAKPVAGLDSKKFLEREHKLLKQLQLNSHFPELIHTEITIQGQLFLIMEYLDPDDYTSLKRLAHEHTATPDEIIHILEQIAEAMEALYEIDQTINTDPKTDDILISTRGKRVVMLDIGVTNHDLNNAYFSGTPEYAVPELRIPEAMSPSTNVYLIALHAFELLKGTPLYDPAGKTSDDVILEIMSKNDYISRINILAHQLFGGDESITKTEFIAVFVKALSKDPRNRYESPPEFVRALSEVMPNRIAFTPRNEFQSSSPTGKHPRRFN